MNKAEMLNFALESGMIDLDTIQMQIEMNERKKYLEMHTFSIWEDKQGTWHTYLPDEKKGRVHRKRTTEKEIHDLVIKYWKGQDKENFTFKTRYFIWIERQRDCGRAPQTIAKYKADYYRFFDGYKICSMDVRNITDDIIFSHFKTVVVDKKLPYKATKECFGYVKGIFRKCVVDKIIKPEENPCAYVDLPLLKKHCTEHTKTVQERTLSAYERKVLLDKIHNPRSRNSNTIVDLAVELSLYTGMRVGELSALRWSSVDYENGYIVIKEAEVYNPETKEYSISTTKNDKIRFFPITDEIRNVFKKAKEYTQQNNTYGEFVFQNEKGRVHSRTISDSVRNKTMSCEFSNAKSVHAIRRTLNSNLRCNGVSATVAASLLGHTQKVNEMNYTYDVVGMEEKSKIIKKAGLVG